MFGFIDPVYLIFMLPGLLLSLWASAKVKGAFNKYSRVPVSTGLTGAEAAREILENNGVTDVRIERVGGMLSDHYDPSKKVLRLSPKVYGSNSVAAVGVAAHEAGHALQHAGGYAPLALRTAIAPVASLGSNLGIWVIFAGFIFNSIGLVKIGIVAFACAVLFSLITLPVELDASRRAKALISRYGIVQGSDAAGVAKVLNAAALTYVAAAVSSILTLLYFLLRAGLLGGRDD